MVAEEIVRVMSDLGIYCVMGGVVSRLTVGGIIMYDREGKV